MDSSNTAAINLNDLKTIEGLVDENSQALTVSLLRWQLRHRYENGLANCCVRAGKRILISKSRYEQWLAANAGK
jgi:hypothetical protein